MKPSYRHPIKDIRGWNGTMAYPVIFANFGYLETTTVDISGADYVLKDILMILGILIVLSFLLFFLTSLLRSRRRSRRHRHRHHHHDPSLSEDEIRVAESVPSGEDSHRRRRKFRKRKRDHRPRNPTLSEAGGLPPRRSPRPSDSTP